jgi:hypothetical protein
VSQEQVGEEGSVRGALRELKFVEMGKEHVGQSKIELCVARSIVKGKATWKFRFSTLSSFATLRIFLKLPSSKIEEVSVRTD